MGIVPQKCGVRDTRRNSRKAMPNETMRRVLRLSWTPACKANLGELQQEPHILEGKFIKCTKQSVWMGLPEASGSTIHPSVQDIKNKEIIAESKSQCCASWNIGLLPFTSLLSLFNVNVHYVLVTMETFNTFDLTSAPGENHTWSLTRIWFRWHVALDIKIDAEFGWCLGAV
jgi:hypothetical protein